MESPGPVPLLGAAPFSCGVHRGNLTCGEVGRQEPGCMTSRDWARLCIGCRTQSCGQNLGSRLGACGQGAQLGKGLGQEGKSIISQASEVWSSSLWLSSHQHTYRWPHRAASVLGLGSYGTSGIQGPFLPHVATPYSVASVLRKACSLVSKYSHVCVNCCQ